MTISLAQLIALPLTPPEFIRLAADTGCDAAGIRLLPTAPGGLAWNLMDDAALRRETLATIEGTGVGVLDLEVVRLGERFDVAALQPFLAVGQQLGARHILVAGDDPDEARLTAHYAALCEAARPYGLSADLEPMPWTAVPDVATAKRVLHAARQPNAGLLVDALHFYRSSSTLADLAEVPPAWLHYAQICDGPIPGPDTTEGLIHAARCERLLPGEGAFDLRGLFGALPADIALSVEVPSDSRAPAMGYRAWARQAVQAARQVLGR